MTQPREATGGTQADASPDEPKAAPAEGSVGPATTSPGSPDHAGGSSTDSDAQSAARPVAERTAPRPHPEAASAAELTEDAIVRFRSDRPQRGWRGALYKITGGVVNPGVGAAERARQDQLRRIRRPLPGSHQIAVSSLKGGVGKTTVSACLGLVLAENRGDRVLALDANPDAGTLADRLTTETSVTVRNLLDNIEATHSLTDVARYTSLAGRLQVLASEQDPAMSEAFSRDEYEQVCEVLTRFYNIVITDSGTGLVHSAMEGTLALADSLVVVGAPTVDGASRASKTLDWLIAHGHAAQVGNAVVVLSCDRMSKEVDLERVRGHFGARCRAVVEIPHDPHLATGGRIELARLRPATHDAFLTLAALLADAFDSSKAPARQVAPEQVPSLS
jgi:MinD-like ATPase involved in chromosome partitioning or flagellar assembly